MSPPRKSERLSEIEVIERSAQKASRILLRGFVVIVPFVVMIVLFDMALGFVRSTLNPIIRVLEWADVIHLIADALDASVKAVHASDRELADVGLDSDDFVLYHHLGSRYPHVLDTCKISSLGWESTPVEQSIARTVEEPVASGRDGNAFDPGRDAEERLINALSE